MTTYLFFDTVSLNASAGGVLNVASVLLKAMRSTGKPVVVDVVSEKFPRLYAIARALGISRFVLETVVYNYHLVSTLFGREKVVPIFPNYFLPFALFGRHSHSIVIVHDLHYKLFPAHFGALKCVWLTWSLRRVSNSLSNVVFISKSSRDAFAHHFKHCANESVILNPVEVAAPVPASTSDGPPRYLIAAYHYYPHKNFFGVLRLFVQMKEHGLVDWLYITGNGADEVARMVANLTSNFRSSIVHKGLVPRDELMRLYQNALAFASLSAHEGFNLSAAEAATLGVPLLLSDIPVHNELFKDYAFLLDQGRSDMDAVAAYLVQHAEAGRRWSHAARCEPRAVVASYLTLH